MRNQTGGCISLGQGMIHARSSKQKMNTKSSTELELAGMSDYLPYNLWLTNFLQEQGYNLKTNVVYQDNQSAIKMERNGRNLCTGNSRHIHIRYFFVKDWVDKGEIEIECCPTHIMLANYFIKPLQGTTFKWMRNVIMQNKLIEEVIDDLISRPSMKERVEKCNNASIVSTGEK